MSFHEVQFPTAISYGSTGGPSFDTMIIATDGGQEERISRISQPRHRYDIAYAIKSYDDLRTLKEFYIARMGAAFGFRFKDWLDFTTASDSQSAPSDTDVEIGVGDDSETQFQLVKKYVSGPTTRVRTLTKPVTDTTVIAIDGTPTGSGWSVNTTTGLITFDTAPSVDEIVTAGCTFDVPVRFGKDVDDVLSLSHDSFETGSIGEIPLVEIVEPSQEVGEFYFGGANYTELVGDITITALEERVQHYNPDAGGYKIIMPDPTNLSLGGPYFVFINASGSYTILVRNSADDATLATLATEGTLEVFLGVDSGSTPTWYFV